MRKQERIVSASVLIIILYTSAIVGIAEENALPYVLTIPIAIAAMIVAWKWPRFQLANLTANILGLLAFALAGTELLVGSIEARLLSGAHLMVYLTWIVLWQRKQLTQYWWLFALCVIQVAIGSILMSTALYGLFLFGFLLLAIWTLAIFSLYRSQLRFTPDDASVTDGERSAQPRAPRASLATGAVQIDGSRWITARFVGGLLGITAASSVVGFVFFVLVPRQWIGEVAWGSDYSRSSPLVGFGDSVRLGSFGTLLESRERVMEVRLFDEDGRKMDVESFSGALGYDGPLFRGSVLDFYEDGQWSRLAKTGRSGHLNRRPASNSIRQEFRLKPVGSRLLFSMPLNPLRPPLGGVVDGDDRNVIFSPADGVLRHEIMRSGLGMVEYEIFTFRTGETTSREFPPYRDAYRSIPKAELRNALRDFAEREIHISANDSPRERARKIVTYLRDSGKFSYTLTIPRRQHLDVDPVVEFLRDRKTGHCQFFATALGLLLRAVHVPSRLVTGFKGGQQNELSGYFEVEQRHAHVWVEALIDQKWVTLDATPAARADTIETGTGILQSWHDLKNYFTSLWSKFVVGMSLTDQSRTMYTPLKETARDAWNSVSQERKKSASGLKALLEFLSQPSRWFSWQGGILSFVLMVLLVSLFWSVRRIAGLFRGLSAELAAAQRQRMHVAFYERFRRMCEAHGLHRQPSQTQREFTTEVAGRLSPLLQPAGFEALPARLAATFYDVRFGARRLEDAEIGEIDDMLTEFERHLPAGNGVDAKNESTKSATGR